MLVTAFPWFLIAFPSYASLNTTVAAATTTATMPVIYTRQSGDATFQVNNGREESDGSKTTLWILIAVIGGCMVLAAVLVICVVLYNRRNSQFQHERSKEPNLSWREYQKRRKMSATERMEEEERQRSVMIRKSLASRSFGQSSRSSQTSHSRHVSQTSLADNESIASQEDEHAGLKEDWKEWEARMQRERSNSADEHPASASSPEISMPERTRSGSPRRNPSPKEQAAALLSGHPLFQSQAHFQTAAERFG